jgi:cysteine dioxygenase
LVEYLDSLEGPAALDELTEKLKQIDICCDDVADFVRFSNQGYRRNLVCSSPWYFLLVLCWKNGQRSPIHDHRGSACGVRVLRGTMTETRFEFAANGCVKAVGSRDVGPGTIVATHDLDLHQVSNLQAGDADLVTLHVYSPPLHAMGTYSLTDTTRGEEPMLMEFTDAAGI